VIGTPTPRALPEAEIRELDVRAADAVNLRRDVHVLVGHVREKGLCRTRRGNTIPRGAARRLAALLSWAGEKAAVEEQGEGVWSDRVADVARALGLVSYDTQGVYVGYSSTEPSFPDNEVRIEEKAWSAWSRKGAIEKERAILAALVETCPNEFFHPATLVPGEHFDRHGCAVGPAGKMGLAPIRRTLLEFLADLEPETWFEFRDVVDLLEARHPRLILDPAHRGPCAESEQALCRWKYGERDRRGPQPQVVLEDLYTNFREYDPRKNRWTPEAVRQLTSDTADVFHRVEGRYLEYFLCEIPYLMGFVDLAHRPASEQHGLDVDPAFERLRALRTTSRLRAVLRAEADFDRVKVTVLPTLEVIVEAPSYPDSTLEALAPVASLICEDTWVHRLRIERTRVTALAASDPGKTRVGALLAKLSGRPLPENVAFEIEGWARRGEQATLCEGLGVLEVRGGEAGRREALAALGDLVVETVGGAGDGFVLVSDPQAAFDRLEAGGLCPLAVSHPEGRFATGGGPLGGNPGEVAGAGTVAGSHSVPALAPAQQPTTARLAPVDLVGYRCDNPALLAALREELATKSGTCCLAAEDLLVLSSSLLPDLRSAIRALRTRFAVAIGDRPNANAPAPDHEVRQSAEAARV
jgi:hypothetical protein